MKNGWTGAQYSVVRVALGKVLALHFIARAWTASGAHRELGAGSVLGLFIGGSLSLLIAVGWFDRAAALLAVAVGVASWATGASMGGLLSVPLTALLVAHAVMPVAPYGSLSAWGRTDPGGGWLYPGRYLALFRVTALLLILGGRMPIPPTSLEHALTWVVLLAFIADPAWIPGLASVGDTTVFYDGTCGICHGFIRFLLSEDRGERPVLFAPLDSGVFRTAHGAAGSPDLGDSVVVRTGDGSLLTKSTAALHILALLGGFWRLVALVGRLIPTSLRDAAYDVVAANRRKLAKAPAGACPFLPGPLMKRFLHD